MGACTCDDFATMFDRSVAERDRASYQRDGPARTTRLLLDMIGRSRIMGASVLDIGGGIGVIDHELLRSGAGRAVLVDASKPYLDVARQEARSRNLLDRIEFVEGDFVTQAEAIDRADIVTLDRVVCCYANAEALVGSSAAHARSMYGLVLPRDRTVFRLGLRVMNLWFRLRRRAYRAYAHPNARIDALVAGAGLRPTSEAFTMFWRVVLYQRP